MCKLHFKYSLRKYRGVPTRHSEKSGNAERSMGGACWEREREGGGGGGGEGGRGGGEGGGGRGERGGGGGGEVM